MNINILIRNSFLFVFICFQMSCTVYTELFVYNLTDDTITVICDAYWSAEMKKEPDDSITFIQRGYRDTMYITPCTGIKIGRGEKKKNSATIQLRYEDVRMYTNDSLMYSLPPHMQKLKILPGAMDQLYFINKKKVHSLKSTSEKELRKDKNLYLLVE